ncbi:hypothetical protein AX16_009375 [Volvariella volvacea WC 439]|nr:hypothetical protein AX16_009375 [Volvariella volvacea WC 439]
MPITSVQKQAIEEVISAVTSQTVPRGKRLLCSMFMDLVDRNEWPHYYEVIPEPRCLNNIKAGVEKGRFKDPLDVYTDLSLVFWNALFYNEPTSQIALDAQTLKNTLDTEWRKRNVLPPPRSSSPPPAAPQKVHKQLAEPQPQPSVALQTKKEPSSSLTPQSSQAPATPAQKRTSTPATVQTPTASTSYHNKPIPIRPKSTQRQATPDIEVDIGGTSPEPMEVDGSGGGKEGYPENEEIVRQLEKGLPRWPGFGEEGWNESLSSERMMEITHAVKSHKDAAGNRVAAALDVVPEEPSIPNTSSSDPLSIKIIEKRAKAKEFTAQGFDLAMSQLFEKARKWHQPNTESYGQILLLQRLYQALTSPSPPTGPPYTSSTNFASLRAGPGNAKAVSAGGDAKDSADGVTGVTTFRVSSKDRTFVDVLHYKGWTVKLADWVHLSNPDDPSRPIVAQVFRCWTSDEVSKKGQPGITVSWYFRPEQTFHDASREFWEGEVFKTSHFADHPVEDIIEKIACQFTARHIRGRPRPPYWYPGFPLYVCDCRYNDRERVFVKIKNWNSCVPEEVRKSTEFMPIYPFEKTVSPVRRPSPFLEKSGKKGPGGLIDASAGAEKAAPASGSGAGAGDEGSLARNRPRRNVASASTTAAVASASAASAAQETPTKKGGAVNGTAVAASSNATAQTTYQATVYPQTAVQQLQQAQQQQYAYQQAAQQQQQYTYQQQYQNQYMGYRGTAAGAYPSGGDRSVITAAGGLAVLGSNPQIEKLAPEIMTNELLWFAAPPMNVPRPPAPRHSMEYLHFLAKKRKRELEKDDKNSESMDVDSGTTGERAKKGRPTVTETLLAVARAE